eukprot:1160404-Pelagomonas_calceolata.AAC.3
MDVDDVAHHPTDHGAALDVPSRPALTPRTGPGRLSRFGSLPKSKVCWRPLALVHRHTLARPARESGSYLILSKECANEPEAHIPWIEAHSSVFVPAQRKYAHAGQANGLPFHFHKPMKCAGSKQAKMKAWL